MLIYADLGALSVFYLRLSLLKKNAAIAFGMLMSSYNASVKIKAEPEREAKRENFEQYRS